MKILYTCIFFLDMAVITVLAFRLFQGMDNGSPVWAQLVLGISLALAIALMVLLILYYLRSGSGPNDK
jgi:hypothetical protein